MNSRLFFVPGFWLIELLAAVGVVFWVVRCCRLYPDGPVARLMRHRDRIWYALLLLFVPPLLSRYLFWHLFFRHVTYDSSYLVQAMGVIYRVFYGAMCGAVCGMAGCWFASPAGRGERFSFWTALTVAVVLMVLISGLSLLIGAFRMVPAANVPVMLAAVVILAFLLSRAFIRNKPELPHDGVATNLPKEKEHNPAFTFLWLLVGLAPIPILLALVSSKSRGPDWALPVFFLCVICDLLGGLGCLWWVKNKAVRIILGIFLGAVFFALSCIVAIFQACSGGGI